MSIYTRRGDDGTTSLRDGTRASKTSARVEAYGTVDEANSAVGLARVICANETLEETLRFVQHRLFNCSSSLAAPVESADERTPTIAAEDVTVLEQAIDHIEARTPELHGFIIETGCEEAARLYAARALMRRAERRIVALAAEEPLPEHVLAFVNRCSDFLFAAARWANVLAGWPEEAWDGHVERPRFDD